MLSKPTLVTALVLFVASCGGEEAGPPPQEATTAPTPAQPAPAAATPSTQAPAQTSPTPAPRPAAARVEVPFVGADTGTVRPDMTEAEVTAVWGDPVIRRDEGIQTFLFFRNGCEVSCGMYDLVILEGGQVVDAVVRFPGHRYDGVSSSPPGSEPVSTPPTMERLEPPASR